ncbi:MAG: TonB-dependent receptor [Edaphobacter sp.]
MRSNFPCLLLVLAFLTLMAPAMYAQSASVNGQVVDPSGALVRNVEITLTNQKTNTVQRTKTNGAGMYILPFVTPGTYSLHAETNGFKPYTQTNITVSTAQNLELDIRVQVGGAEQSVTVNGSGNEINTTDASVSTVIDRQFVQNIPLNGRSFQSLMTLIPGVSVVPSTTGQSGELTVNGQRTEANYFTVDGISASTGASPYTPGNSAGYGGSLPGETVLGTTQSLVSIDALQEFRATTSTYSAEYGRTPGGQFTFSTRSGTNDWHGSAFDYLRNNALDANNWFNNYYGVARQAERQNDFGGTFGGPVTIPGIYHGRDKTFFFFSYEGLRLQQPQAAQQYEVPSLTLRQQAPAALQPFLNTFPIPNGGDAGNGLSYFTSGYVSPSSLDTTSIRIDHSFSDSFKVFGRYSYAPSDNTTRDSSNFPSPSNPELQHGAIKTLTLGSTNILTPQIGNEARFNTTWNDSVQSFSIDTLGGAVPLSLTDFPGMNNTDWMLACLNFGTSICSRFAPQADHQRQWNVTDTLTANVGRHNLKWGIDYRRLSTAATLPEDYPLVLFFNESAVQQNLPNFFVDYHSQGNMNPVYLNISAFAQDEWKVSQRLNLSLGLRWELNPAPYDSKGNNPYTITTTNLAAAAVAPQGTPLWQTTYDNFAPRFGFAYQIHQQPGYQTVLRAGSGVFYDTGNTQGSSGYFFGVGITSRTSFAGSSFPLTQAQLSSVPAPSAAEPYSSQVIGFDPHLKLPYTWQWNVSLEQELGESQSLTLSYVASAGRRLLLEKEYNPAQIGNNNFVSEDGGGLGLYLTTNGASSDYNALQVQFQRRLSHGLQALFSYTWSHAFDDATSNFQVFTTERAPSDNDIRNNFQAALTYDLPATYANRFAAALLGQWSVDARVSARSSLPVDILGSVNAIDSIGTSLNFHPNRVANAPLYVHTPGAPGGRLINYNAFTIATDAAGNDIEGDFPRNGTRGFDAAQADLGLRRDFPFTKRVGLQFRAEAFNILNHPIYGTIYNELSDGSQLFGMAYQTQNSSLGGLSSLYQVGGPRSLQLALRLHF